MIKKNIKKYFPFLLILGGLAAIFLAVAADYLKIGTKSGIGNKQIFLISFGFVTALLGILLATQKGRHLLKSLISPSSVINPVSIPIISTWFGLLTGFGEVAILANRKYFNGELIFKSFHFFWMIPVGDLIVFLIPGILFYLSTKLLNNKHVLKFVIFTLIFLQSLSIFLLFQQIHIYAVYVLSIGLAIQVSRIILRHLKGFYHLIHLSFPVLLSTTCILFIIIYSWQNITEKRMLSQLPIATPNKPNVLLIVLDTVRAQNMSLYGYSRSTTPSLDNLAKSGVLFEQAFSTAPWTVPSHASIFTGHWPHELSAGWITPLDNQYPTLSEIFNANGYFTAGFVANDFDCSYEFGFNRGFSHYEDYKISLGQALLYTSIVSNLENKLRPIIGEHRFYWPKTASEVNNKFLSWLDGHQDRPFFVFLNYMDAHDPYQPPDNYENKFGDSKLRANPSSKPRQDWSQNEIQADIDAYDGSITYLDSQINVLIEELEKREIANNTLIIITSDHGEQFNDHGLFTHGNSLYSQVLHVPLLIIFPSQIPAGENILTPVSLRDLPTTILEITKLEKQIQLPGKSLAIEWLNNNQSTDNYIEENELVTSNNYIFSEVDWEPGIDFSKSDPITRGDMRSLVIGNYHYIKNGDGIEELYNLLSDPFENIDLFYTEEGSLVIEKLKYTLTSIIDNSINK